MTRRGRRVLAAGVLVAAVGALIVPTHLRWRAHVVLLYLTGQIPDIGLKPLLRYMMPGSDQYLKPLIETHNPYAVIHNARTTPADIEVGAQVFRRDCASCHAPDGSGGRRRSGVDPWGIPSWRKRLGRLQSRSLR